MEPEPANLPNRMPSSAAERMRNYRQRRRKQVRCLQIELHVTVIDGLIAKGFLEAEKRYDPDAVRLAIDDFFFMTLD